MQGNYLMKFDLHRVGGEHGNQIQRYNEFLGAGEQTYVDWHNFTQYPRFWDLSSTRYIVTAQPAQLPGVERVFRGRRGVVYENGDALSRAYLAERVFSSDQALEVMKAPKFEPGRMAVVPSETDLPRLGAGAGEGSAGSAEVVTYEPDRVVVEVEARRPALLVLNDNYYPGWRAEVDGTAASVVRANHTFRGVTIREAGTHTVEFEFRPASLYRGLWISVASLGLMVVVPVVGRRWRRSGEAGDA